MPHDQETELFFKSQKHHSNTDENYCSLFQPLSTATLERTEALHEKNPNRLELFISLFLSNGARVVSDTALDLTAAAGAGSVAQE